MTRRTKVSVGNLADEVMQKVAQEQLVKTAALSHTSKVTVKTAVAQLLTKTAASVREEAENPEISYTDLAKFLEKHDR